MGKLEHLNKLVKKRLFVLQFNLLPLIHAGLVVQPMVPYNAVACLELNDRM